MCIKCRHSNAPFVFLCPPTSYLPFALPLAIIPCRSGMFPAGMCMICLRNCPPFGRTANQRWYHALRSFYHVVPTCSLRGMHMICLRNCPPFGRTANQRRYHALRSFYHVVPTCSLRGMHMICLRKMSSFVGRRTGAGIISCGHYIISPKKNKYHPPIG